MKHLKMPPRITPRTFVLTALAIVGVTLFVGSKCNFSYFINTSILQTTKEILNNGLNENSQRMAPEKEEVKEIEEVERELTNAPEQPYFVKGGTLYPTKGPARLFPEQTDGDRIVDQLMYVPEDYQGYDSPEKLILAYNRFASWGQKPGPGTFQQCPVNRCSLTGERNRAGDADAILFKEQIFFPGVERPMKQLWILYHLESPYYTRIVNLSDAINWTATYRRDSDIVAPYGRWVYYDTQVKQKVQQRHYATNKTKKVAWFVSNCKTPNNRLQYARELGKHIKVDIYGKCGSLKCPRSDEKKCFSIVNTDYKFYLSFENSNCRDYITEKLFVNGLGQNVLPIVMGARPEDYQKSAPEGSYIHVDEFASPEELAVYLHRLDNDDALYNSYFKWKETGEFINTYFWCRLCAMLHAPSIPRHYENLNDWWRGPGACTSKSWRNAEFLYIIPVRNQHSRNLYRPIKKL